MMASSENVGESVHALATAAHHGILALAQLPKPVVAAVHGSVAGGGIGLLCAADLILAGESTKFVAAYPGSPSRRTAAPHGCCHGSSANGEPSSSCF